MRASTEKHEISNPCSQIVFLMQLNSRLLNCPITSSYQAFLRKAEAAQTCLSIFSRTGCRAFWAALIAAMLSSVSFIINADWRFIVPVSICIRCTSRFVLAGDIIVGDPAPAIFITSSTFSPLSFLLDAFPATNKNNVPGQFVRNLDKFYQRANTNKKIRKKRKKSIIRMQIHCNQQQPQTERQFTAKYKKPLFQPLPLTRHSSNPPLTHSKQQHITISDGLHLLTSLLHFTNSSMELSLCWNNLKLWKDRRWRAERTTSATKLTTKTRTSPIWNDDKAVVFFQRMLHGATG